MKILQWYTAISTKKNRSNKQSQQAKQSLDPLILQFADACKVDLDSYTNSTRTQGCYTRCLEAFWHANQADGQAALSITPYMNQARYCR